MTIQTSRGPISTREASRIVNQLVHLALRELSQLKYAPSTIIDASADYVAYMRGVKEKTVIDITRRRVRRVVRKVLHHTEHAVHK